MKLVSIIVCFYNEIENISECHHKISQLIKQNKDFEFEIIFINDGSTDQTTKRIKDFQHLKNSKLIEFTRNFGAKNALLAGIIHSRGDYLFPFPADCQEPNYLFNNALDIIRKNNNTDLIFGIRKSRKDPPISKVFSNLYSLLMRRFAIDNYPKKGLDSFFISRKLIDIINKNNEINIQSFLIWTGFEYEIVFYEKELRKKGKSKWSISKKVNYLIDNFVSFSTAPLKFITISGLIMLISGTLISFYTIYLKLFTQDVPQGWTTLISVLLIGFGMTNFFIGIISFYLVKMYKDSKGRDMYMIKETYDL